LYRLVTFVVDKKLTSVAWPVWGAELRKLREATDNVRIRALFRIPRTYRDSVRFLVSLTSCCDTIALAVMAGRLYQSDWQYAWAGLLLVTIANVFVVVFTALIIASSVLMELPFGNQMIDMPGLSYTMAAAEISLQMVSPINNNQEDIVDLNFDELMSASEVVEKGGTKNPWEEKDDDDDDDEDPNNADDGGE